MSGAVSCAGAAPVVSGLGGDGFGVAGFGLDGFGVTGLDAGFVGAGPVATAFAVSARAAVDSRTAATDVSGRRAALVSTADPVEVSGTAERAESVGTAPERCSPPHPVRAAKTRIPASGP